MRVELDVAWAGIRHRPALWVLLAIAVALAAVLPVVAAGLRTEATVAAVRATVDALPPGKRSVIAVTSRDVRGTDLAQLDAEIRSGLDAAAVHDVSSALGFRPVAIAGQDISVGADSGLQSHVRLTGGRWPKTCTPQACEVLAVTPPGSTAAAAPLDATVTRAARTQLGLVVTGSADLVDDRLVGAGLLPADIPLLLGDTPSAIAELAALDLFGRNNVWVGPLDAAAVAAAGVPAFSRTLADLVERVNLAAGPLSLVWPAEAVASAADRARAAADRFGVLGAGAGVLQLGFCLVAASGLRRRALLVGRLLARRGASPSQVTSTTLAGPVLSVLAGLIIGVATGALLVGWRGRGVVERPWSAAADAVTSVWPTLLGLAAAAVAVVTLVLRWPEARGAAGRWTVTVALLVAAGVSALLLIGGASDQLATTAVVTVLVTIGLLAAWAYPGVANLLSRPTSRPVAAHPLPAVARLVAARRPLLRVATTGFIAAACGVLVLGAGYRSSLAQSAADQAAAAVPLDVGIFPSAQVAVPLDVVDAARITALSPDISLHPVVSSPVTAFAGSTNAKALPLVGLDLGALPQIHEFAATTGSDVSPADLVGRLASTAEPGPTLPVIPAGTRRLTIAAAGADVDLEVDLWVSTPEGRERRVALTGRDGSLTADLPSAGLRASGPLTVRALELSESDAYSSHRQHGVGEGSTDRERLSGTLRLGVVRADATTLPWTWPGWTSAQAKLSGSGPALQVRYAIGDTRVVLTPPGVRLPGPLPVAVDPDTAARAGRDTFAITVNGRSTPVRVVAVLPRFPATAASFVLADRTAVSTLLDVTAPGTAAVSAVWITAPGDSLGPLRALLDSSAAATADVKYRVDLERAIAGDPVAVRSLTLLAVTGLIALVLASVAAATAVRADQAETVADAYALEVDGVAPAGLRALQVRRMAPVVLLGVGLGVAGGLLLTVVAVHVLITGPAGAPTNPPLRVDFAIGSVLGITLLALAGTAGAAAAAAALGYWAERPEPAELDLR